MFKDGRVTTNGWLFITFLFLIFTTPYNPFITHRYLPLVWYAALGIYGIWLLAKVTREEGYR